MDYTRSAVIPRLLSLLFLSVLFADAHPQLRLERPTVAPRQVELKLARRTADFDLGPGPDWAVLLFDVAAPGKLSITVEWTGPATSMQAQVTNIAAAEQSGRPNLTLDGTSPLTGTVQVDQDHVGQWGVGLRIESRTATGTVSVRPTGTRISALTPRPPELPVVDPAVGRFLSLYFYHVERALNGIRQTELDRRLGDIIGRAPPRIRQTYTRAVAQYRALPLQEKARLGFDTNLVQQLENINRPLSQQALRQISRQILQPLTQSAPAIRPRPRTAPRAPFGGGGDADPPIWSVGLKWTRLVCHDESDACAIDNWGWTCTEAGSDEPVAIFLMLDGAISTQIAIDDLLDQLSDNAKAELVLIVMTGKLSQALAGDPEVISAATYQELTAALQEAVEDAELEIDEHWVKRTRVFGGVEDGSTRSGSIQLIPRSAGASHQTLREAAHSWGEGTVEYTVPLLVAVGLIFELDNGVGGIMDAIESHAASIEAVADEIIMDAILDMAVGGVAGGFVAGLVAGGPVGMLVGMGVGALIAYWMQPEFIGHAEAIFTTQGYTFGATDMSAANSLIPLTAQQRPLVLHGMFTGSRSDYELRYDLVIRSSQLRCRTFDPAAVQLTYVPPMNFYLVDGQGRRLVSSRNVGDIQKALQIIKGYGLSSVSELGHPEPSMTWWLVDGRPPQGPRPGEDATPFNPDNLQVARVGGEWKIIDGDSWLLGFDNREQEARAALSIIQQHGFTHLCFVGRPDADMVYFRK